MNRTNWLQETRMRRFEETYDGWQNGRLTQEEAALLLGVCSRTFRRYIYRYEADGMEGLMDRRIAQASHRRAALDEVLDVERLYRDRYRGWNVRHFHSFYRYSHSGKRSYSWVKNTLQRAGLVIKAPGRGKHRRRRERAALPGMMLHQDGSTHQWVPGKYWDLIVTMDDATNEHYSMFFVNEESTASSFAATLETIEKNGLFCSIYTDRGSHYWHTPEAGGKVDKTHLTQFGRAMRHLGITMIPAYSPEARGRSERQFATHQDRLVKELALHGITEMAAANEYLAEVYQPAINRDFKRQSPERGNAFVAVDDVQMGQIKEQLCEHHERVVGNDNCVSFEGKKLQIPPDQTRYHYVKVRVRVHRYPTGRMAVFHGPRKLADYEADGSLHESITCAEQTT
jgi:hypothetical protein